MMAERVGSNPRTSCPVAIFRPVLLITQPLLERKIKYLNTIKENK